MPAPGYHVAFYPAGRKIGGEAYFRFVRTEKAANRIAAAFLAPAA